MKWLRNVIVFNVRTDIAVAVVFVPVVLLAELTRITLEQIAFVIAGAAVLAAIVWVYVLLGRFRLFAYDTDTIKDEDEPPDEDKEAEAEGE